jgi:hypothetical protein
VQLRPCSSRRYGGTQPVTSIRLRLETVNYFLKRYREEMMSTRDSKETNEWIPVNVEQSLAHASDTDLQAGCPLYE